MNIGIVGCGAIANYLLQEINEQAIPGMSVSSIYIRDKTKYTYVSEKYGVELFNDLSAFLHSNIDIVVEAANIQAVHGLIPTILKQKDVVLISIGALADEGFFKEISLQAEKDDRSIYLPSGAVGGLDLLQNANALGGVTEVALSTRKPARALLNKQIDNEKILFEGSARKAIALFPENINVSIILSLAGVGLDQTKVKVIADPTITRNIHTVTISGTFGSASFTMLNHPLQANPKTSYLAALSIINTLKKMTNRVKIG